MLCSDAHKQPDRCHVCARVTRQHSRQGARQHPLQSTEAELPLLQLLLLSSLTVCALSSCLCS